MTAGRPVVVAVAFVLTLKASLAVPLEAHADATHAHQAQPSPVPSPLAGEVVPEFDAVALEGRVEHVAFPKGSATVLLFFLSSCPHCHQMIPRWNEAYARRAKQVKVYGVILDQEPPGFFTAMPVAFPVLRSPGRTFTQDIKVFRTPTALRLGAGGKIEDVQVGIFDVMSVGTLFRAPK